MKNAVPLVIFKQGLPLRVPADFRQHVKYKEWRKAADDAEDFPEIIRLVERASRDQATFIAADFAPQEEWARRFIATTARYQSLPKTDKRRRQSDRALHAWLRLLMGTGSKRGRRPERGLTPGEIDAIRLRHSIWLTNLVRPYWDWPDRWHRIQGFAKTRFNWSRAHEKAFVRLRRRPARRLRPSEVAVTLTAWEMSIPITRVQTALRLRFTLVNQ